jgi:hypothetical protein
MATFFIIISVWVLPLCVGIGVVWGLRRLGIFGKVKTESSNTTDITSRLSVAPKSNWKTFFRLLLYWTVYTVFAYALFIFTAIGFESPNSPCCRSQCSSFCGYARDDHERAEGEILKEKRGDRCRLSDDGPITRLNNMSV